MRLRVALDTSFAGVNVTGVGKYSRRLAEWLDTLAAERRLEVSCMGPSCVPDASKLPLGGLYQEWPTYTQLFLPARLSLAKQRPHIVHSTSHLGPLWGPGKLVVTVHDVIFKRFPADYGGSWLKITETLLPRVLRRASAIIADSEATRDDLQRFFPESRGKVHVIYPGIDEAFAAGVDPSMVAQTRNRYGLGERPYLLCLGPWVRRKNLGLIVEAFSVVAARLPELQLVLTGQVPLGMEAGDAGRALASLPGDVRQRVKTVGHVPWEEVPALVRGASVLAYPSLFEGFGLPPLEAMSAGVPVIASNTAAVAEAVAGGALLLPPEDPGGWATAIERVLSDPQEARRLTAAGLQRAAQFSWKRCAEETIALYYRVAKASML